MEVDRLESSQAKAVGLDSTQAKYAMVSFNIHAQTHNYIVKYLYVRIGSVSLRSLAEVVCDLKKKY